MNLWEAYFSAVRKQNWQKALEHLNELKGSEPENPQVFLKLGDAYQKLGKPEKAIPEYSQAAWLFLKDGFVQKALAVYKIILRLDPHNQEAVNKSRDLLVEIELSKQGAEISATVPESDSLQPVSQDTTTVPFTTEELQPSTSPHPSTVTSPPTVTSATKFEELIVRTSYEEQKTDISATVTPHKISKEELPPPLVDPDLVPEFLKDLSPEEIRDIMTKLKACQFKKGETIIEEGDSGDSVYTIKSGKAIVTTHVLGKKIDLATLQKGDLFGEVAFLTGRPRTATVTALEDMEVLEFTRPLLEELIEKRPELLKTLQDFYYSRLQNTIKKATQTHKRE
jgi:CRP-like cAMP-binding protein